MLSVNLKLDPTAPAPIVVIARARFLAWLRGLENAKTARGARFLTSHIDERRWAAHYARGHHPIEALDSELVDLAD